MRKHRVPRGLAWLFLALCCCFIVFSISPLVKNLFDITVNPPIDPRGSISPAETDLLPTPQIHDDEEEIGSVTDARRDKDDNGFATDTQSDTEETSWCLILVNKWNRIPDVYSVELTELSNGQLIDKRIYPALQDMFDAARSEGIYPIVVSGYRSAEKQQSLMDDKIAEYRAEGYTSEAAIIKAEAWVAIPGTSEHQIGIAVDINADGIHSAGYEVYEWLSNNAHMFGFICRYPEDKTDITGVISEPWHYRYVGIQVATEIQAQGICLEEYLITVN